jgi:hypothetical protein
VNLESEDSVNMCEDKRLNLFEDDISEGSVELDKIED